MIDRDALAVTITDERSITVPNGCSSGDLKQVAEFLTKSADEGYRLKSLAPMTQERGTQRDPLTVTLGVRMVLSR